MIECKQISMVLNERVSMKRKIMELGVVVCVGIGLMCGCASDTDEMGNAEKKADKGQKIVSRLTFGYQPSTHQIAYMTAMDKGWWRERLAPLGVEEIKEKVFPTGAPEMQAMLTHQIDVAYVGSAPFITALSHGLDARIIAAVQVQGSNLVLRPEYAYTRPEDIKGLKIATFPPGTIQDTLLREWLLDNGIDPKKDVDIRGMGPGDAISAIAAENVMAVFLPHPAPTIIELEGNGRSIVASGEMKPNHACCVLVATGSLIRENPDLVQAIVETHVRATRYNCKHKQDAARFYSDRTSFEVDKVMKSLEDWDGRWLADPFAVQESVVAYAQTQKRLGYIDKELTEDEIFTTRFYSAIVQEQQ